MANPFGKYDIQAEAQSVYCYAGTSVLKNRFGIRNAEILKQLEADLSAVRQNDMLLRPVAGRFTPYHLCRIHRYMFSDLYSFAGHYRRENIAKGHTRFLPCDRIGDTLRSLLDNLRSEQFLEDLPRSRFTERCAYYFAELNYIHPFREGNGRATREFMRLLFLRNGYEVLWDAVEPSRLLSAMELSVFDSRELTAVLRECLSRKE